MKKSFLIFILVSFCLNEVSAQNTSAISKSKGIAVTPSAPNAQFYRSKSSGSWNMATSWEVSDDKINWKAANRSPDYSDYSIAIRRPHNIHTGNMSQLIIDETTIDSGATLCIDYSTKFIINNGEDKIDFKVNGVIQDSSNHPAEFRSQATWVLGDFGTLVKISSTTSLNWQKNFHNGISNIPSTSNWICRKSFGSLTEPWLSSANDIAELQPCYGNLYIENYSTSWNTNGTCKFSGLENFPVIKGNFYIGGNGNGRIIFSSANTNSSPIKIFGNLFIKSGSKLSAIGTGIELQGDLIVHGSYDAGNTSSKLLFAGAKPQIISGKGIINTFHLEINKTHDNVTFNNSVTVDGNLYLTDGIAITTASSKLILNKNATTSGASHLSFVSGPLQKKGDSHFTFPVGKENNFRPVSLLEGVGAQPTDVFTAEYIKKNPQAVIGKNLSQEISQISSCEYWYVHRDAGNALKSLSFPENDINCTGEKTNKITIARFNETKWEFAAMKSSAKKVEGIISTQLNSAYGAFTLALPRVEEPSSIAFLSFTGRHTGPKTKLYWITAKEENNKEFTIERSQDGRSFSSVFSQPAAGNSKRLMSYTGEDLNPLSGTSYYRLKQIKNDGNFIYSDVIPIRIQKEKIVILSLDASKQTATIDLDVNFPFPSKGTIKVTDQGGKTFLHSEFNAGKEIRRFSMNSSNLSTGVYYLKVFYGSDVVVRKFSY